MELDTIQETIQVEGYLRTSISIAKIAKALSQFQGEVKNPANSAVNPFYKSKYAPLAEVLNTSKPILSKYGLATIQNPYTIDGKLFVTTMIVHESGEWIETLPLQMPTEKNTPQGIGSAITYGRRYSLSAALGLSSEEDDDGNINEKDNKNNKGKKESAKTSEEPRSKSDDLRPMKLQVMKAAKAKSVINDEIKTRVKDVLAKYDPSGNPNKVNDIEKLKELLVEINNINVEEK